MNNVNFNESEHDLQWRNAVRTLITRIYHVINNLFRETRKTHMLGGLILSWPFILVPAHACARVILSLI